MSGGGNICTRRAMGGFYLTQSRQVREVRKVASSFELCELRDFAPFAWNNGPDASVCDETAFARHGKEAR